MEEASIPETLVDFYQTTWHNIPEDSHLQGYFCDGTRQNSIP
jgi:hypothetical protein